MEQLLEILEDLKPGVDFTAEDNLVEDHVLDSLSIVRLVGEINDEFDIQITPLDVIPENFRSAETIWALIERLLDE